MRIEAMRVFNGFDDLRAAVGTEVGVSDWIEVTQDRIDKFAEATCDEQWIHVDQERAIHGLDSVSQRVLVLNLQSKHMDSLERHWYFPATMEQKEKPLWFRVRRKQD